MGTHGCKHYERSCLVVAPCCQRAYGCHVCHDEDGCRAALDKRSISALVCAACSSIVPSDLAACPICDMGFGESHVCKACHIYSHDKPMWHCAECGICRLGDADYYVHCSNCDACVPLQLLEDHACAPYAMHRECVVCSKYLFSSRTPVAPLPCGHLAVHLRCRAEAGDANRLQCPNCQPEVHPCSGGWGGGATSSLEGLLESLRMEDVGDGGEDSRNGLAGDEYVYESSVYPCARVQWPADKVYLADGVTRGSYVRRFNELPREVIPEPGDNSEGSRAVHRVAEALKGVGKTVLSVDRVHVGGSFGRKTTVDSRFDVDLLVFTNNVNPKDNASVVATLQTVASALEDRFRASVKQRPEMQMLQLELDGVEMDVLLVRNVATYGDLDKAAAQRRALVAPLFSLTDGQIAAMALGEPDRARERAVSEALTAFVKGQPGVANDAVRMFKAWVKCGLAERRLLSSKKLPSIALELIVLAAYQQETQAEKAGGQAYQQGDIKPSRSLMLRVFIRALGIAARLLDPGTVVMVDAGPVLGYSREQGLRFRRCWGTAGPYVVHPVDPTCNVARDLGNGRPPWDWAGLARQSGILLTILRHCSLGVLLREASLGAALYRLQYGIGK